MNFLFDVSPEEPVKKKGRKREQSAEPACEKKVESFFAPARELHIIGRIDDVFHCADEACNATAHDIIDEHKGEWRIECCFCGTGQRVQAIDGVLREPDAFVFRDGVFEGLSVDEAVARENGMDYVEWASKSHKRAAVRDACARWLDSNKPRS